MPLPPTDFSRRGFFQSTLAGGVLAGSLACRLEPLMAADSAPAPAYSPKIDRFPIYRAAGTPRELGQQHGEQARQHIHRHLDYMCGTLKLSREQLQQQALRFQPLFEQHCPDQVEELAGLGEGAGVSFAEALATNIRGALTATGDGGCTSFVVSSAGTVNGQVLLGQNSDMLPAMIDMAYVLHLQPRDKPQVLMWTFGGMLGYHGINSQGVGNFANDLGGGPQPRFAMPHYPLKRLLLECGTLEEILAVFRRVPLWSNGNYVLCDADRQILDVEATPSGPHLIRDQGAGYIAHSNHFLCEQHATAENHQQSAADSFSRLTRMDELIRARYGRLGVADFEKFLRDRAGDPSGICRFAQTDDPAADWVTAGITVASIIAEPQERRLRVAVGNREDAPFVIYRMA